MPVNTRLWLTPYKRPISATSFSADGNGGRLAADGNAGLPSASTDGDALAARFARRRKAASTVMDGAYDTAAFSMKYFPLADCIA